ncbi:MAG TPA: hypothetical protein DD379_04245 [Cyanobacteria bacterium UBA11162]|nr:hypothetical protein [Cyanobacteria bacterium UBA11162]
MNILYLTTCLPSKKGTGGDIASQHFIDALKKNGYNVSVVGYLRKGVYSDQQPDTISVGERYIETKEAKLYPIIWFLISFFKNIPYSSAKYYSKNYIHKIRTLLSQEKYDCFILEHSSQLIWLQSNIEDKNKLIVLAQNIENEVYLERIEDTQNPILKWIYKREVNLAKKAEEELARIARQIWTLTRYDANYFLNVVGTNNQDKVKAFDLPSSLENPGYRTRDTQCDIALIGSWIWKPNLDGLRWFFQCVYPHLPTNLTIEVAGRGADWLEGLYPNVSYRGFVPDAQEFILQSKTIAIPSIRGAGVQIKTLDAIGLGLPIVATPFALRGISNPPPTVKVAEEPEQFAKLLISSISSPCLPEVSHEAIKWASHRQTTFFEDVASAIETFQ